jgi:hypothetical protein
VAQESIVSLTIFQVESDDGPISRGIQTESDEADAEVSQISSEEENIYNECMEAWTDRESNAAKYEMYCTP